MTDQLTPESPARTVHLVDDRRRRSCAVQLTGESTGVSVIDSTVMGRMRLFEIDRQSEPGFQESGNTSG